MMLSRIVRFCIVLLMLWLSSSCSKGSHGTLPVYPGLPDGTQQDAENQSASAPNTSHHLWTFGLIRIDPQNLSPEFVPLRVGANHFNILNFLEQSPCGNCLTIGKVSAEADGILSVDITLTHPFKGLNQTGFDTRGIVMFSGSHVFPLSGLTMSDKAMEEGELVNPDGYTTLYNPDTAGEGLEGYLEGKLATTDLPNSTLNAFKRFNSDYSSEENTRNAFYGYKPVNVTYKIHMPAPPNAWVFGYAIDACWAPPINKPVNNPMTDFGPDANCPEPWDIKYKSLVVSANDFNLVFEVYDRQGGASHADPVLECPELFDGTINAVSTYEGDGFARYDATFANSKSAPAGHYRCLISVEDNENDPDGKPWLDLTAYNVFTIGVSGLSPVEVTPPWLNNDPHGVCIDGNLAYVAGGSFGLHIYDVTDPANPVWIGKATADDFPMDFPNVVFLTKVSASDGLVAVCNAGEPGMAIIDADPPESAHYTATVGYEAVNDVFVSDGYAYMVDVFGLSIVDISIPESPVIVKSVSTVTSGWSNPTAVAISDGYAYVTVNDDPLDMDDADRRLFIVDIDPPEAASVVKTVSMPSRVGDIEVSGGFAYVPCDGMCVVDIDPPESAQIVQQYPAPPDCYYQAISISGNYIYALDNLYLFDQHLRVGKLSQDGSVSPVASYGPFDVGVYSLATKDNAIFLAIDGSLRVMQFDPPDSISLIGEVNTMMTGNVAVMTGNVANMDDYVYGFSPGLRVIDISSPETAFVANVFFRENGWEDAYTLAADSGYLYASVGMNSFEIVDVDPPDSAILAGEYLFGDPRHIAIFGGYAFIADDFGGYRVLDVDPPESVHKAYDGYSQFSSDQRLTIEGHYMYYSNTAFGYESYGFGIYDISDPENPDGVGGVKLLGPPNDILVSDGYAYLTVQHSWLLDQDTLVVVDVDPPEEAHIVCSVPVYAGHMAVANGNLLVTPPIGYGAGIVRIFDIDLPEQTQEIGEFHTVGLHLGRITVSGQYAYIEGDGLEIFKLW